MRTATSLVAIALVGVAAGCSRGKPVDSKHLDLVLSDVGRRAAVVSPLELAGEAKVRPVALARSGATAQLHAHRKAHNRPPAPRPKPAPAAEHARVAAPDPQPSIAAAPAPAATPAPVPESPPDHNAEPADPQAGHGWGGWPAPGGGGVRIPGIPGGVIIIRGGHSGMDPCDEHDRRGIGGGFPGLPGRMGRGAPGGVVFIRGR